jgi:hypothetical protein
MVEKRLNNKLEGCSKENAVFKDSSGTLSIEDQKKAYREDLAILAEEYSARHPSEPVGTQSPGHGFLYKEKNYWERVGKSYCIKIMGSCPQKSAKQWLESFASIELALKKTGVLKNVTFIVGSEGKGFLEDAVASGNPETKRIEFYLTKNGKAVSGCALENATRKTKDQIKLCDIILHEIGHILARRHEKVLGRLQEEIGQERHKIHGFLKSISPHYLGKQSKETKQAFDQLQLLLEKGITETKLANGREVFIPNFLKHKLYEYTDELFAETLRHFYLKPLLKRKVPAGVLTGWVTLDKFREKLTLELKQTLEKPRKLQKMNLG